MRKKWLTVLLSAVLSVTLFAGTAAASSAPLSFSTSTLTGQSFDSSIIGNYDLTMINVWAEWCGPCMREMPDLEKIHQNYPNVLLLGAYVDENISGAISAAANAGVTYTLIRMPYVLYDYLEINGGSFSIPQTLFFDRNGKMLGSSYVGSRGYSDWAAIVNRMLAEAAAAEPAESGLRLDDDGVWRTYENGAFVPTTGVVEYQGGLFFVSDGVLCADANGLALFGDQWYFLAGGQVQAQYTGLAEYDGALFYVANGLFNPNLNGLVDYDGSKFIVAAGQLIRGVNGLWQNTDGVWYYLADSQVVTYYTGLALYDGAWFYVINGRLAAEFTGPVEYDGSVFNVVNGQVQ